MNTASFLADLIASPDIAAYFPWAVAFVLLAAVLLLLLLLYRAIFADKASASDTTITWVVIDGSNVMYWKDNTPRIETVRDVVVHLTRLGLTPGVVFDANAGYLLTDRYQHDRFFSQTLGLPQDRVMVVPKGTPADPFILTAARDMGARIVTNDRFRDWAADFPEVKAQGHLITGGYGSAGLWVALDTAPA